LTEYFVEISSLSGVSLIFFILAFRIFHTYSGFIRYSSIYDLQRIALSMLTGSAMVLSVLYLFRSQDWLFPINGRDWVLMVLIATIGMFSMRMIISAVYENFMSSHTGKRVFIYGVKTGGVGLARFISDQPQYANYKVVGFISDKEDSDKKYLMGKRIYANNDKLAETMKALHVEILMVSPLKIDRLRNNEKLVNQLIEANIKIIFVNSSEEWDGVTPLDHARLKEVEVEDLLPRAQIQVDMEANGAQLRNKVIMITGAAGSIGHEMVRQIAVYKPRKVVLIDQAETPMHDVRLEMKQKFPYIDAVTIVTSITKTRHMRSIFAANRPDYVFHAAAYKHVPMMEDNPAIAIQNNCYGTRVIADLSVEFGVKKFVMVSTDKAVNPTNVMGCSKRICEIYVQSLNKAIVEGKVKGVTQFVTTRFGNVLGSNGSVIPLFREQIQNGGPITVTHPDIIRYFMLIPEACKLVIEAGTMGKGGEIFVFDMGQPVKIVDLAKRMIKLSGAKDVQIQYTGLRDGEKLFEEVLNDNETTKPTHHPKIMIADVREYDYEKAKEDEEILLELSYTYDDMAIVKKMKEIVPEYKSQHSKFEKLDK
jgi:FlaA1/EpsC-like NDP-sugar epimerase